MEVWSQHWTPKWTQRERHSRFDSRAGVLDSAVGVGVVAAVNARVDTAMSAIVDSRAVVPTGLSSAVSVGVERLLIIGTGVELATNARRVDSTVASVRVNSAAS